MPDRKSFLLRVDRELLDAVQRWANDDLRSLNGQIEFLLRRALLHAGRQPAKRPADDASNDASDDASLDTAPDEPSEEQSSK